MSPVMFITWASGPMRVTSKVWVVTSTSRPEGALVIWMFSWGTVTVASR